MSLSTITSFSLLSYALLVIARSPAKGYELSIYSATPIIFWFAIIFGLLNGIFLISSQLFLHEKPGKMWMVGLFEIIFCNCLLISLYALRGYVLYFGRGDPSSLVGMAKDVSNYGYFGNNVYPIISIFISQVSQFTNLPIIFISKYVSSMFFVFYFLSVYCWSKSLLPNRKFVLSSLIASIPIFFAWYSTSIYPNVLSVFTLPFFFYLLHRNSDYRFRFFCIIFLIMYPFFHPITSIIVFLYLIVFFISEKISLGEKRKKVSTSLLLISFVSLIAWFIQQYSLLRSMKSVLFQLIGLLKMPSTSDEALYFIDRLGFTTAIRTLGLMITDEIIFFLLSLIVIYLILSGKEISIDQNFYKISICFIIGNLFYLILFFSTRTHSPYRMINLNFNVMLTPILVGYLLYKFSLNNKKAKAILILSLIIFSAIIAMFSLYPSPITMLRNNQVTIMDVRGISWLITQKDHRFKTADVATAIYRFSDLIYGCKFQRQRPDLSRDLDIPDHFGLNDDDIFHVDENKYLFITEFDMKPYIMEIWEDYEPAFYREDFTKINTCTNIDKIYENNEFRTYFVRK